MTPLAFAPKIEPEVAREPQPAPLPASGGLDPAQALALAVRQFNTWRFWECHETLEDLWRAQDTPLANFYQGLIKLAAGFHHLLRGNHRGAVTLLGGGLQLLEPFRPRTLAIDVDPLLAQARACYDSIVALGPQHLADFDRALIPAIAFTPDEPDDRYIRANGLNLHYLEWPKPAAPAAVLLHATGFLARLWQPIAQELAADYHVLALDQRGHGDSDKPPGSYPWLHFVDDLIAFLDALDLRSVLAIGHSMGGATIAHTAAIRPDLIGRAVLIEPVIFSPQVRATGDDGSRRLAEGARKRRTLWPSREAMYRSYRERPPFDTWQDEAVRLYVEYGTTLQGDGQAQLKCPGEIEAQVFEGQPIPDTFAVLPQVRCPTLVLYGQHSEDHLAAAAREAAARIPGARLVAISEASHFLPMERPEAVVQEIRNFLREAGSGPAAAQT